MPLGFETANTVCPGRPNDNGNALALFIPQILQRTVENFPTLALRKPHRGGMFIDTEPIHDFLFVFQRRDGDAELRLTSAGIERASPIRLQGAAPLKNKKNCA